MPPPQGFPQPFQTNWPVPYAQMQNYDALGGVPDRDAYSYGLANMGINLADFNSLFRAVLLARLRGMQMPYSATAINYALNPQTLRAQQ